jgi:hypothetical protein
MRMHEWEDAGIVMHENLHETECLDGKRKKVCSKPVLRRIKGSQGQIASIQRGKSPGRKVRLKLLQSTITHDTCKLPRASSN